MSHNTNIQEIIIGLRSLDRGADFNAYLSANDFYPSLLPAGIGIEYGTNAAGAEGLAGAPGAHNSADNDPVPSDFVEFIRWRFESAIAIQYFGTYRVFLRASFKGPPDPQIRFRFGFENGTLFTSPTVTGDHVTVDFGPSAGTLWDLGTIQIPSASSMRSSDTPGALIFALDFITVRAFVTDIILLPTDEWVASLDGETPETSGEYLLDVDSIGNPKEKIRGLLRASDESVIDTFLVVASKEANLRANTAQRLWIVTRSVDDSLYVTLGVSVSAAPRYHHLRGD